MADTKDGGRVRDPLEEGDDRSGRTDTSGNREESMAESEDDAFGKAGKQNPASSGTESLTGEPDDASDRRGPGGVEGTS